MPLAGGLAHPEFGVSVNPFPTRGQIMPTTLLLAHLTASASDTSFESLNFQVLAAGWTMVRHYHLGDTPTSAKSRRDNNVLRLFQSSRKVRK